MLSAQRIPRQARRTGRRSWSRCVRDLGALHERLANPMTEAATAFEVRAERTDRVSAGAVARTQEQRAADIAVAQSAEPAGTKQGSSHIELPDPAGRDATDPNRPETPVDNRRARDRQR